MVVGLVPPAEEERICKKLISYYEQLYPGIEFSVKKVTLGFKEVGEIYYTFPGEEAQATALQKMKMINSAIGEGYKTPIIILRTKSKDILLDGHRRVRVAFSEGLGWQALAIIPSKDLKFGIEEMIMGKVKDLYGE